MSILLSLSNIRHYAPQASHSTLRSHTSATGFSNKIVASAHEQSTMPCSTTIARGVNSSFNHCDADATSSRNGIVNSAATGLEGYESSRKRKRDTVHQLHFAAGSAKKVTRFSKLHSPSTQFSENPTSRSIIHPLLRWPKVSLPPEVTAGTLTRSFDNQHAIEMTRMKKPENQTGSNNAGRIYGFMQHCDTHDYHGRRLHLMCCYFLTAFHSKGTDLQELVQDIMTCIPNDVNIHHQLSRCLGRGRKWKRICEIYASICEPQSSISEAQAQAQAQKLGGLVWMFHGLNNWERADDLTVLEALKHLHSTTELHRRTIDATKKLEEFMDCISGSKLIIRMAPINQLGTKPLKNALNILCKLINSLGGNQVPETLLAQGVESKQQWTPCSSKSLQGLFTHRASLQQTLDFGLESGRLIKDKVAGQSVYSLSRVPPTRRREARQAFLYGLYFLIRVFPHDIFTHLRPPPEGRDMLPYLGRFLMASLDEEPVSVRSSFAEVCLAASFQAGRRSHHELNAAERLPQGDFDAYLRNAVICRRSQLLRWNGQLNESDQHLSKASLGNATDDKRLIFVNQQLILSRAENLVLRKHFGKAQTCLNQMVPCADKHPGDEPWWDISRLKTATMARCQRYNGEFECAMEGFKTCIDCPFPTGKDHLRRHLADMYCELKQPELVLGLLEKYTDDLRKAKKIRLLRRTYLPLAEAKIQLEKMEEAKVLLTTAKGLYGLPVLDINEQLDYVRIAIGLARILLWKEDWQGALDQCESVDALIQDFDGFESQGFYRFFIYRMQALTSLQLNDKAACIEKLKRSEEFDRKPQHFITGLGTYVLKNIEQQLSRGISQNELTSVRSRQL